MVENNEDDNIKRSYKKYNDKSIKKDKSKKDIKYFLEWTKYFVFSIFLLILIIMGMGKVATHFSRRL